MTLSSLMNQLAACSNRQHPIEMWGYGLPILRDIKMDGGKLPFVGTGNNRWPSWIGFRKVCMF